MVLKSSGQDFMHRFRIPPKYIYIYMISITGRLCFILIVVVGIHRLFICIPLNVSVRIDYALEAIYCYSFLIATATLTSLVTELVFDMANHCF